MALLIEHGYDGTTMLAIANRARLSKDTLYRLHVSKAALFATLIQRNAADIQAAVGDAMHRPDLGASLERLALSLLALLTSDAAVALERAAIEARADTEELARLVVEHGRGANFPRIIRLMAAASGRGDLAGDAPEAMAEAFIGLVLTDLPVQRLLGALPQPSSAEIAERARQATGRFLRLYSTAREAPMAGV